MRELPSGTVTFLFSDIEGSTRLLDELGAERYAEALAEHRRLIRAAFSAHGGVEVDTQGDALFVAFPDARGAVAAAGQAQEALSGGPVAVRMGLHTGEPLVTAEGYVGIDVHRGARVMSAGHGGQVLISEATFRRLDGEGGLVDLGLHRLKDLTEPQRLWQLGDGEFPPLKTLYQTNLPVQPTPLVGRELELAEVIRLLESTRLLTLTGAGGSGKTRLALQAAAELVDEFEGGVWWVSLAALRDPGLVESTIAQVVGADDGLGDHLRSQRALLLLDNFEQVITAATVVAELIGEAPDVRILVTSRERLGVLAEQEYAVPTMVPREALALFTARARQLRADFEPDSAVAEICRRLDGLPLAVELAAARSKVLEPEQILERLGGSLALLTGGARDAPERQQTLRATIEWSHDLLEAEERRVFRALAVFAGSFDVDAAGAVCRAGLDTLQSLVDKSLARRWGSGRFGMLDTIHEYARERLEEAGEAAETQRRHADHYLAVARTTNLSAEAEGPENSELARLEIPNFRAVLSWAAATGETELGLQLAVALARFWVSASPFEADHWFSALLSDPEQVDPRLRAAAFRDHGGAVYIVGEFDRGLELYERSLDLYRALQDDWNVSHVLHRLARDALRVGDHARARELTEEARALARGLGDLQGEALALSTLGAIADEEGDTEQALELLASSADAAERAGFTWWHGGALLDLAEIAAKVGRLDDAERWLREGLAVLVGIRDRQFLVYGLAQLAAVAAQRGQLERAGLLWGAVEAEERRGPLGQWESQREEYVQKVLTYAGPELEAGREAGRNLSLDEAVEQALAP